MLESHRLQIERSKLQIAINELPEIRMEDPEAETRQTERATKVQELLGIDQKLIDALENEDKEAQAAMSRNADASGWDPELRELHSVASRVQPSWTLWRREQRDLPGGWFEHLPSTASTLWNTTWRISRGRSRLSFCCQGMSY